MEAPDTDTGKSASRRTLFSKLDQGPSTSHQNHGRKAVPQTPLTPEEKNSVRSSMLDRLAHTEAHFAHRQRDEPDLSHQEKVDIAAEILDRNRAVFLSRFGGYLLESDLQYFQDVDKDSYEVQFHLNSIRHRCAHSAAIVKNRRYSAMRELEAGGEYFSEDEMKRREPLLFEQMVGQYLTEEEKKQKMEEEVDHTDLKLSTILLKHMEDVQERTLYKLQKEKEDCQQEESEEEEEEEDDDDKDKDSTEMEEEDTPEISGDRASDIWRQQLRSEFKAIMQEKFLSGKDTEFDYSKVDRNPDYDSMAAEGQDEEDRYFFSENPHSVSDSGSDMDCDRPQTETEKTVQEAGKEEEDDYMKYKPSAELVEKSIQFKNRNRSCSESFEDT